MKKRLNLFTLLTLSLLINALFIRNANKLSSNFTLCTNNRLSTVNLPLKDIGKIIQNLNPNKVPENENINICMLKIFVSSIYVPLELIFNKALSTGLFPSDQKKENFVPIHQKGDKSWKLPSAFITPIFGKILERLIFNELTNFLPENNLMSPNQSGFKPGDSCISQLLSIARSLPFQKHFLDIFEAFDKVWHNVPFLNCLKMSSLVSFLDLLSSFLSDRKHRFSLNGQTSQGRNATVGVPRGSTLWPLLFFIYINDLSSDRSSKVVLFANDSSLFSVTHDITTSANDLKKISGWAFQWKISFNPDPSKQTQEVIFSRKSKTYHNLPWSVIMLMFSSCKS